MKIVAAVLMVALLLVPGVALAGSAQDAALALGAFAVFNQMISGTGIFGGVVAAPQPVYAAPAPVYVAPQPVYAPPPVIVAPAPVVLAPRPVVVHRGHGHGHWKHVRHGWGHRGYRH
jgi:hypothetical protein